MSKVLFADEVRLLHLDPDDPDIMFRQLTKQLYASRCFYNLAFQEMIFSKGHFLTMRDQVQSHMVRRGSVLSGLLPVMSYWWMQLCEDIMASEVVQRLRGSFL